jgi:TolB-like protein/predicted Ser/Thr protein kinase
MRAADPEADTMDGLTAGETADRIVAGGALVAGRYRILQLLGTGGMGSVYRALDTQLDELVALKTLRRERLQSAGALERFRREMKLARKVTHRGVARAFDIGEHEGEPFLTMELVEGRSLGAALQEGALALGEAARIGEAIAEALSVAHAAGVVHRDLKPDNVLLATDGRVVLTDFGIARALDGADAAATGAGGIVGTPAYMAPEQVEASELDGRTDLYALGVVLFEMATGTLPFEGTTPLALAAARLVRPPRDLATLAPTLPASFVDLVRALLSRSPVGRPANAEVVRVALGSLRSASMAPTSIEPLPGAHGERERKLAVMRLRGASGDDAWIADGFSEDLVDALSTVRGVRVRALAPQGDPRVDARTFGQREGVDVVVEGSTRRETERVRVSLRLVSVDDGFQIWAQRFEANVGGLLGVSDAAAHAIAKALAGAQHHTPPERKPASEAVELLLRARSEARSRFGESDAMALVERALVLAPDDPSVLAAFVGLTAAEAFRPGVSEELLERGRIAGERAMALAPHLPEPYVARAQLQVMREDRAGAVRSLMAGHARGPSFGAIDDQLGRILFEAGRLAQARAHIERALWIDPRLPHARVDLGRLHAYLGDRPSAERQLDALKAISSPYHSLLAARLALWWKRPDLLVGVVAPPSPGDAFFRLASQATVQGTLDAAAVREHGQLIARTGAVSRPRRLFQQILGEVFASVGEHERALVEVRGAVAAGLTDLAWLTLCPLFDPIRSTPDYGAAIAVVEERARPVLEAYDQGA